MPNADTTNDGNPIATRTGRREPRDPLPLPAPHGLADFARRVLITILLVAVAYLFWRGTHILLEAFAGVLFAVFLSALSGWVSQRTQISRGRALTLVVFTLFVLTAGLGWLLASHLANQTGALVQKLPQSVEQMRDYLGQYPWGQFLLQQIPEARGAVNQLGAYFKTTLASALDFLVAAVVISFVGIFGAAEPDLYKAGLLHLVPYQHRRRTSEALDAVAFNLRWWLVGQVVLMVVIGVTTTIGLALLGIDLALTLGVIAGILELIPYVGPWISAVPACLMALLVSPAHVLGVAALYLFLHVLEGYVLLPLVQRRAVLMPPALTLVMQVLLGELLGPMGLFVAAPLTVAGVVLLKMLYIEDTLGDQAVDVPGEPGNEAKPAARENREHQEQAPENIFRSTNV